MQQIIFLQVLLGLLVTVRSKEALLGIRKGIRGGHRVGYAGFYGSLVVSYKDTNVHFAVDTLQKWLDGWKAQGIFQRWPTTPVHVLHDLWDNVRPELVGNIDGLDVFNYQNTTGFDAGEPKEERGCHVMSIVGPIINDYLEWWAVAIAFHLVDPDILEKLDIAGVQTMEPGRISQFLVPGMLCGLIGPRVGVRAGNLHRVEFGLFVRCQKFGIGFESETRVKSNL